MRSFIRESMMGDSWSERFWERKKGFNCIRKRLRRKGYIMRVWIKRYKENNRNKYR